MMNDAIILENYVDPQCVRHVHVMANSRDVLSHYQSACGRGEITQETGAWHFRADYPYSGVLDIECVGNAKKFRRLVVCSLEGRGSVREAIQAAFTFFWTTFGFRPAYVFIKKLPKGAENGQDVDGMVLSEANWMLEKCVAVGGKQ